MLLIVLADSMAPTTVRTAAADALGALQHAEAAAPLASVAEDEEQPGTLRARAVRALGLIGATDTLRVVLACTRSPHEAVRAQAVLALGGFPVAEATQALGELVADSTEPHGTEPDVARAAVHALSRIGAAALPVLIALADSVDDLSEDLAGRLVAALAARPEAGATAVLSRLAAAPSPPRTVMYTTVGEGRLSRSRPAQEAASIALIQRGTAECLMPLTSLLSPGSWPGAHEAAVRALMKIGTAEAHESVVAYCCTMTYLHDWHVQALDAIAEVRAVRLGP